MTKVARVAMHLVSPRIEIILRESAAASAANAEEWSDDAC